MATNVDLTTMGDPTTVGPALPCTAVLEIVEAENPTEAVADALANDWQRRRQRNGNPGGRALRKTVPLTV